MGAEAQRTQAAQGQAFTCVLKESTLRRQESISRKDCHSCEGRNRSLVKTVIPAKAGIHHWSDADSSTLSKSSLH